LGQNAAQGQFEQLTSFPYACPDLLLGIYYRGNRRQADLGAIRAVTMERGQTAEGNAMAAMSLEPPGGGGGGGDTNCLVPWQPLATNGLRLVIALTNGTTALTIVGGETNVVYDFFSTPTLVGSGGTNCTWIWLGQGLNSNTYYVTVQTNLQTVFMVGTPDDTDGDGLTDAYEKLVSHTDSNSNDTDADGLSDGWELALGLNPLSNDNGQLSTRSNFTYDGSGFLRQVSGMRTGTIDVDAEGNVLQVSQ
jgi:hypothetical protein